MDAVQAELLSLKSSLVALQTRTEELAEQLAERATYTARTVPAPTGRRVYVDLQRRPQSGTMSGLGGN